MIRRVTLFVAATAAAWLLVAVPVRYLAGDTAMAYSLIAMLLCLVPAAATLAWSAWAQAHNPAGLIVPVLGGTGLRLMAVSIVAVLLYNRVEYLRHQPGFLEWVVGFYLLTLTLEMVFLVAGQPRPKQP